MAQFNTANTFVDGDIVHGADLNNIIDQASALVGLITDQGTPVTAAGTDQVLINRAGVLKRANVSTLPSGVTSVSTVIDSGATILQFSVTSPSTTPVFHIGLDAQGPGKVLAGPVSGVAATPTFRLLNPADLPIGTIIVAAQTIDWSLGNTFSKLLSGNTTFIFTNPSEGQTIRLRVQQDASHTVAWASPIRWPGGTPPVMTTGGGRQDIFTFSYIGTLYYGTFQHDFW